LILTLVSIDCEQFESAMIVDAVFLGEHEDQSPQVADEPRINRIIAFVCCHEDFGHRWEQALKAEFLHMLE